MQLLAHFAVCYNDRAFGPSAAYLWLLKGDMNNYEMVFIISPEVQDEEVVKVLDKITGLITGKGGSVTELNQWGRKKLAYPITNYLEGNYVLARFNLPAEMVKEVETNLAMSTNILRHLVIRTEEVAA
jgi:small subunit ribosomal protein S6